MLLNINRTNLSVFVNLPQMLCKHLHWFHIIQATKVAENGMLQFTPCRHAIRPTGKPKYHLHQTETCQNHKTDFDVIVSVTLLHSSGKLHNGFILSLAYRLHKRCRITDLLLNYNIYTKNVITSPTVICIYFHYCTKCGKNATHKKQYRFNITVLPNVI